MRSYILSLENVDVFEGTVTSLLEEPDGIKGVAYKVSQSGSERTIQAPLTIVSDGPFSRFRGSLSTPDIEVNGYFVGIMLKNCPLPKPGYGHLVMGDHPPFVMYPVNSNEIRILIDFPGSIPPRIDESFKAFLIKEFLPHIPDSMKNAFENAVKLGGFKMMPNHRLPASPTFKQGAVLIGDSLNMRHPLTGGGMTAAFADVALLSSLLIEISDFDDSEIIMKTVRKFYLTRHLGNQTINILADGLYGVVTHPDLQESFFEYVLRGGKFADEPIAILCGLNKDKKLLRKHFFAVANYGTKLKIKNEVGARKLESSYSLVKEAVRIITPLLMSEKPDPATMILLKTLSR
jgi:squalene monooxygenase